MYAEAPAFHLQKKKKKTPEVRRAPKHDLRVRSRRFILQNKGKNFFPELAKKQKNKASYVTRRRKKRINDLIMWTSYPKKPTACLLGAQTIASQHLARPNGCQTSMST